MQTILANYISLLKGHGLATNNLYLIRISFGPNTLLANLANYDIKTKISEEQKDNNLTGQNQGILSGLVNTSQINQKIRNIQNIFSDNSKAIGGLYSGVVSNNHQLVEMLCTETQIPFYKQKLGKTFINHMDHKFSTGLDTDAIKMTFYVDRKNAVLDMFTLWNEQIYVSEGKHGVMNYKNDYAASKIEIVMVNKNSYGSLDDVFVCTLSGAYPSYIEPITLNNNNTEIIQLSVTFEYDKIFHETVAQPIGDKYSLSKPLTGFNILDMKNTIEQGINDVKDMGKIIQNTVKSTRHTVEDMKNTAKRILKF